MSNMQDKPKARLMLQERKALSDGSFAELVVWQVPSPVEPSAHDYKYRLAYVTTGGVCILRYDNERGKGDHKHVHGVEHAYAFTSPAQLIEDFWADVARLAP